MKRSKRDRAAFTSAPLPPVLAANDFHFALLGGLQEYLDKTYGTETHLARELLAGCDLSTVRTQSDFFALVDVGLARLGLDPLT